MDFEQAVRRRRMVRRFDPHRPVDQSTVDRLLDLARRAPSAGHSQGWHFLVLTTPDERQSFWAATTDPDRPPDRWLAGMSTAPVLIICWSDREAYVQRYAESDKRSGQLDQRWAVPYWHIDTGMAALLLLLGATDSGLGACLFGVPPTRVAAVRSLVAVPERFAPVGVVALGHPRPDAVRVRTGSARRDRRPRAEVVSYGRFGVSAPDAGPDAPPAGSSD